MNVSGVAAARKIGTSVELTARGGTFFSGTKDKFPSASGTEIGGNFTAMFHIGNVFFFDGFRLMSPML